MSISDAQKTDFLWKRVFYGLAGTAESPVKEYYNETIPSYSPILNSSVWADSDNIPSIAPSTTTATIIVYNVNSAIQMTADPTVLNNSTWLATSVYGNTGTILGDWINQGIDPSYQVAVYDGNPASGGKPLYQLQDGQEWVFDYSAGVLHFPNTVPANLTQLWITGYRYVGRKGVAGKNSATVVVDNGAIDYSNLVLGEMIFSKNDGTNQWVLYMVTSLLPLVLTPITTESGNPLATPNATFTRLVVPTTPSVINLGTLSAGTVVTTVEVTVIDAFNGATATTLSVGDDQDTQRLIDSSLVDLYNVGGYANLANYTYLTNTPIRAYFANGGSTLGKAEVAVTYVNQSVGTTGQTITFIQTIDPTTTSPIKIGSVKAGQTVLLTEIAITTGFDGDPNVMSMSIGTSVDHNLLMDSNNMEPAIVDTYTNASNYLFDTAQDIYAYFDLGGSANGLATVSVTLTN